MRRVVIVGGGFGGLTAAQRLRGTDVEVTVIDRTSHHLFQPLLYQVAAGALSSGECAAPIRTHLRRQSNAGVVMAEVVDVDVELGRLTLERGERVDYDDLIVACGARSSYFGHDEWQNVSFGLKTLEDAVAMRGQIFAAFEEAARAADRAAQEEWMTFAVVGGGPTGVELAGQLAILARRTLPGGYSRIDTSAARVILFDAGERVVPAFTEKLSAVASRELGDLGVTVREGVRVTSIDPGGLTVQTSDGEERVAARTVIWAAGVRPAGIVATLAGATGARTDRLGRIEVEPDLTIAGHPEIRAIGDIAKLDDGDGKPLPGLATVAIQQAHHAAQAIGDGGRGGGAPFRYFDKGALAVVGSGKAVGQLRSLELSGRVAFYTYLMVHLYYLSGVRGRRHRVFDAWRSARFGTRQNRVIVGELPADRGAAAPAAPDPADQDDGSSRSADASIPAVDVHNRLDKVVLDVGGDGEGAAGTPLTAAQAREVAAALQRAADTAERTG